MDDHIIPGALYKAARLAAQEVTDDEIKQINKYALSPLTSDEVFTFRATLCDTEIDRQHERFSARALKDLQKLFVGKPVIKDHNASADNQVARIYATEVVETGKTNADGSPYLRLDAKCYMVRTASNADLITDLQAGIKKEGSVGFRPSSSICSICGTDNAKEYCRHWPGRTYYKDGAPHTCVFTLDRADDAYEFSLVAVPAQRAAGVSKSYTGETVTPDDFPPAPDDRGTELTLRARLGVAIAKMNR